MLKLNGLNLMQHMLHLIWAKQFYSNFSFHLLGKSLDKIVTFKHHTLQGNFGLVTPKCLLLVNSEVPDEMRHNTAFHQGLHYLHRQK